MPKDKKKVESESEEYESEYESEYEYETETGEGETETSGDETSGEEGTTSDEEPEEGEGESEDESEYEYETETEESDAKPAEKAAAAVKKAVTEESSEYEYETESEYEYETETQSSEKPAPKAVVAKPAATTTQPAATQAAAAPAAPAAAAAAAPAERDWIQHGLENEHPWAPKRFMAEFVGTFALCWGIYMTRGTVADPTSPSGAPAGGLVGVALVHAFVLAAMAASFGSVSGGHFNPAVTFTFIFTRQIEVAVGIVYIIVQFAAGILAGALTWGLLPPVQTEAASEGGPIAFPGTHWAAPISCGNFPDINDAEPFAGSCVFQAFGAEIFGTLFLLITIFMSGVAGYGSDSAYIAIGLALGLGVLATGPISNACLNPARALGAAAFAHNYAWDDIWAWFVGPLIASIVCALLYGLVFQTSYDKSKGSSLFKRDD